MTISDSRGRSYISLDETDFLAACQLRNLAVSPEFLHYLREHGLLAITESGGSEYYSIYQLDWLDHLLATFQIKLLPSNTPNPAITVGRQGAMLGLHSKGIVANLNDNEDVYQDLVDFEALDAEHKKFQLMIDFLYAIEGAYFPYSRSGGGAISIRGDYVAWREARKVFDLTGIMKDLNIELDTIGDWYISFSHKACKLLGGTSADWIQLWKEISWDKKEKLEGSIRLGIDYLSWGDMLKRVIEDSRQEILDIDEIPSGMSGKQLLEVGINHSSLGKASIRPLRDEHYSQDGINFYHDRYKRLQWLANSLGLNYQPRLMVFVEGESEETSLPEVFAKFFGMDAANLGIEFVNFHGVGNLISTAESAQELEALVNQLQADLRSRISSMSKSQTKKLHKTVRNLKNTNAMISNWESFISYNLEKWQTIPFFLSDNEGTAEQFIDNGLAIRFETHKYNIPHDWRFVWGVDNHNNPLIGKDFEMANFFDAELAAAISGTIGENVSANDVATARSEGKGINQLNNHVEGYKKEIMKALFESLWKLPQDERQRAFEERPIFTVLRSLSKLVGTNHQPTDLKSQLLNREIIRGDLKGF